MYSNYAIYNRSKGQDGVLLNAARDNDKNSLLYLNYKIRNKSSEFLIRMCDIIFSLVGIVFISPLLLLIVIAIKATDKGPVFFAQERIGINGKKFKCYKFRSMYVDAAERLKKILETDPVARAEWAADHKLKNDTRITPIGQLLRKTSLDELPQLINVILGEMSLVGPRPIVDEEAKRYGRTFRYYVSVLPGITGYWQISGRNDVSYRRRVALDRFYCGNKSFGMYIYILAATLPAVILQKGSY